MTATKTTTAASRNGSAASAPLARAKEAGDTVASAARKAKSPLIAAGATAAGLAGGVALGSRLARPRGLRALVSPRRKVFGVALGRESGVITVGRAVGRAARELSSATDRVAETGAEVRQVREQLDRANRQSPIEVLLDGLTHRRGAHRREN
jgi:hypothetical protein